MSPSLRRLTPVMSALASRAPHVAELFLCAARAVGARLLPLARLAGLVASPAGTADLFWDVNGSTPGQGGTGTWDLSNPFWNQSGDGVAGPFNPWDNGALWAEQPVYVQIQFALARIKEMARNDYVG